MEGLKQRKGEQAPIPPTYFIWAVPQTEQWEEKATTEMGEREVGLHYLAGGKVPTYFFWGTISDRLQ